MSAFRRTPSLIIDRSFEETQWVKNIQQIFDIELDNDDDDGFRVCIFNVPEVLMSSSQYSYMPQRVSIGPYHYWRPELYGTERLKLAAAKGTQKRMQTVKFHHAVEKLKELEARIRACYHKFLELKGETLAWMLAMDASFLLEFLQIYAAKKGKVLANVSIIKSGQNEILRDIIMLENQIPLFVLRKMLEFQLPSMESADDTLFSTLVGLCIELSPFKVVEDTTKIKISESFHILDFLYQTIVPKNDEQLQITEENEEENNDGDRERAFDNSSSVKRLLKDTKPFMDRVFSSVTCTLRLSWKIVSNLPGISILKVSFDFLFPGQNKETANKEDINSSSCRGIDKPPLVEEITIPSVSELSESGVHFVPVDGEISTISFDTDSAAFYLPTIRLDVNTEIVLRNLVAYEASNASGPLLFTRYTELMNGIIDTEEDVRLLREQGIVLNHLKSDGEAASLWNGMSKSIRLTKVPFLDKAIEDVNRYYNGRWRVKIGRFVRRYVYGSWRFLTFLAAILLLLLVSLQALSFFYSFKRLFFMRASRI